MAPRSNALYKGVWKVRSATPKDAGRAGAADYPERADEAHARAAPTAGLRIRPQHGGQAHRDAVPARFLKGPKVLHADRRAARPRPGACPADRSMEGCAAAKNVRPERGENTGEIWKMPVPEQIAAVRSGPESAHAGIS